MAGTLVYGFGNVGRKDDGLGVVCAQMIEVWANHKGLTNVHVEYNYQLNIEDAETISHYQRVYFVDATLEDGPPVLMREVAPRDESIEFSMHAISPAYVLQLCHQIFGKKPDTHLITLKGYVWDFEEGLSPSAQSNLDEAFSFLKERILEE